MTYLEKLDKLVNQLEKELLDMVENIDNQDLAACTILFEYAGEYVYKSKIIKFIREDYEEINLSEKLIDNVLGREYLLDELYWHWIDGFYDSEESLKDSIFVFCSHIQETEENPPL